MGLFERVKNRIKSGIGAVTEEARHPGRPPSHKASSNPFHAQPEEKRAAKEAAADVKATQEAAPTKGGVAKPWYLDGNNDGWDDTDPKKEE
jgi:hypothetical protein